VERLAAATKLGAEMQLGEMIVVLIVILLMYRPLLWLAKRLILRAVTVWNSLDKGVVQFGNVVGGDLAGGDIHKGKKKDAKTKKE